MPPDWERPSPMEYPLFFLLPERELEWELLFRPSPGNKISCFFYVQRHNLKAFIHLSLLSWTKITVWSQYVDTGQCLRRWNVKEKLFIFREMCLFSVFAGSCLRWQAEKTSRSNQRVCMHSNRYELNAPWGCCRAAFGPQATSWIGQLLSRCTCKHSHFLTDSWQH